MKATVFLAVLVLASFSLANGQAVWVDMADVQGLTADGFIPEGGTSLVVPIRYQNAGEARTAISNGFKFTGDDLIWLGMYGEFNAAYPFNWDLAFGAGCYPPACYPYFDQGTFINDIGAPAYGIGFAGLTGASGSGLPVGFDDIAVIITIEALGGAPGAVLTMDSTWWEPANSWLWSGVAESVSWGGPYEFVVEGGGPVCDEPYTTCWPQPSVLKALENDRILNFSVFCEDVNSVVITSMRVGNIPPYTGARIEVDSVVTDALFIRFLGASGFRPIPSEGIQSTYTLTYDVNDGTGSVSLIGDFVLTVYQGDVNFDTEVNIEDVVFLTDHLYDGCPMAQVHAEEMAERMDVDVSGRFDLLDVQSLLDISGL